MGRWGFSYVGLVFLLMLTIPNLIWVKHQPKGYHLKNENRILLAFERVGQILVTCTALICAVCGIFFKTGCKSVPRISAKTLEPLGSAC